MLYTYAWLGLAYIPMILYLVSGVHPSLTGTMASALTTQYMATVYYRRTSREVKRVESLLRSHVYSSFAEQVRAVHMAKADCSLLGWR